MNDTTNIIRFRARESSLSARQYNRSFPPNSVSGRAWIGDVLDDLLSYCHHFELEAEGEALRTAREAIRANGSGREADRGHRSEAD